MNEGRVIGVEGRKISGTEKTGPGKSAEYPEWYGMSLMDLLERSDQVFNDDSETGR